MKCPSCGLDNPDKNSFCSHCGAPLSDQGKMQQIAQPATKPPAPPPAARPDDMPSATPMSSGASRQEERTLWQEYPSMRTATPLLVAIAIAYVIVGLITLSVTSDRSVFWMISLGFLVLFVIVLVKFLVRLRSLRYRVSNQRIFIERGLLNKRTDEIELEHYKDVFVNQTFWDRMTGCGDIEVVTGDATTPTVHIIDVVDPISKKEIIRTAARERKIALGIIRREEL
jgi:membrane protein YdbS with pleckstrin-like domain